MTYWGWQSSKTTRRGYDTELDAIRGVIDYALNGRRLAGELEPQQLSAVWTSLQCAGFTVFSYEAESMELI